MIIHNPTDSPVADYPIQDPTSKEVNLWTIGPGQTLEFPDYVGTYLLDVYGFLQEILTEEQKQARDLEKEKINKNKQFTQEKIVPAKGVAIESPEATPAGMTAEKATNNPEMVVPCADTACTEKFNDPAIMKQHFFDAHIQFAGTTE